MPTTQKEITDLVDANPFLGYDGWRTVHQMSVTRDGEHHARREKLRAAVDEIDLCRRMYADPRFLRERHGHQNSYHLKHVAERWVFGVDRAPQDLFDPHYKNYNRYVSQGAAIAAALMSRFRVDWDGRHVACMIVVPRYQPAPAPRLPSSSAASTSVTDTPATAADALK